MIAYYWDIHISSLNAFVNNSWTFVTELNQASGDFDKKLQTELSTDLYSFIATVKLDEGDSFHDVVDVIFKRDGAKGLGCGRFICDARGLESSLQLTDKTLRP